MGERKKGRFVPLLKKDDLGVEIQAPFMYNMERRGRMARYQKGRKVRLRPDCQIDWYYGGRVEPHDDRGKVENHRVSRFDVCNEEGIDIGYAEYTYYDVRFHKAGMRWGIPEWFLEAI